MDQRAIDKARKALAADPTLSTNKLSGVIGVSYYLAARLKEKIEAEGQAVPQADGDSTIWSVEIGIPEDRADELFASFTAEEKMCAIQHVIQARMDAMLNPAESEAA